MHQKWIGTILPLLLISACSSPETDSPENEQASGGTAGGTGGASEGLGGEMSEPATGGSPATGGRNGDDSGGVGGELPEPATGGSPATGGQSAEESCQGTIEEDCIAAPECIPIYGYSAVGGVGETYVGCRHSGAPDDPFLCGDAIVCGVPDTGTQDKQCMIFNNDCIPGDWTLYPSCDAPGCPDPGG